MVKVEKSNRALDTAVTEIVKLIWKDFLKMKMSQISFNKKLEIYSQ